MSIFQLADEASGGGEILQVGIEEAKRFSDRICDLEEAWAGIQYVLSLEVPIPKYKAIRRGICWDDESLDNAIMGGEPTDIQTNLGPARLKSKEQVSKLAVQLSIITRDEFWQRYDADGWYDNSISPGDWEQPEVRE